MSASAPWSLRLISELDAADRRAVAIAQDLKPEQLNWHPAPGVWSIGQCLDHLHVANQIYLPAIWAALEGKQSATVSEIRLGAVSAWFIRNYIAPDPEGSRAKAPKKIEPSQSVDSGILKTFLHSNQAARDLVQRASLYDVNAIRFKNPLVPLVRFTVGTGLEIVAKHEARHLLQAERVRQSAGFP